MQDVEADLSRLLVGMLRDFAGNSAATPLQQASAYACTGRQTSQRILSLPRAQGPEPEAGRETPHISCPCVRRRPAPLARAAARPRQHWTSPACAPLATAALPLWWCRRCASVRCCAGMLPPLMSWWLLAMCCTWQAAEAGRACASFAAAQRAICEVGLRLSTGFMLESASHAHGMTPTLVLTNGGQVICRKGMERVGARCGKLAHASAGAALLHRRLVCGPLLRCYQQGRLPLLLFGTQHTSGLVEARQPAGCTRCIEGLSRRANWCSLHTEARYRTGP